MGTIKEAGFMLPHMHITSSRCHEKYFLLFHGSFQNRSNQENVCDQYVERCISTVHPFVIDMNLNSDLFLDCV
jgi:hypothetical protein